MNEENIININQKEGMLLQENTSLVPRWIGLLLYTSLFTGLTLFTTYLPIHANIPINIIVPIIVLFFLKSVFFEKLKLSTLICNRILVAVTAIGFISGGLCITIAIWLFRINIMEAALADFKGKRYFNFITGIVLVATSFLLTGTWNGTYYTLIFEGVILWIIAYTFWNWTFVLGEFGNSISVFHIAVLLAPLFGTLITMQPGLWFLMRGNSLTPAVVVHISNKERIEKYFDIPLYKQITTKIMTTPVQIGIMVINIILCLIPVIFIPQ